jgi:hypothetical protein
VLSNTGYFSSGWRIFSASLVDTRFSVILKWVPFSAKRSGWSVLSVLLDRSLLCFVLDVYYSCEETTTATRDLCCLVC